MLAYIAYFFSPVDFIPDFIPGIGQIDDAAIGILTLLGILLPPVKGSNTNSRRLNNNSNNESKH